MRLNEALTKDDISMLIHAQDLQLVPDPYSLIAKELGWTEEQVISRLRALHDDGIVRRMAASLSHRKLGFHGNVMCVLKVPEEAVDEVGTAVAENDLVTHCYHRRGWDFNLFFMVHGKDIDDGLRKAGSVLEGLDGRYEHEFLHSTEEFKKESFILKEWKDELGL